LTICIDIRQGPTWEEAMRLHLATALLALSVAPLHATEEKPEPLNIGYGIICNTSEQALRIVALRNEGSEVRHAVGLVNQEAGNAIACGDALVVFRAAEEVHKDRIGGQRVTVMKIIVNAVNNGGRWSLVPDLVQYALVIPAGIEV
jgi:hypothetical protein